jgi:hypothetical protein
MGSSAKPGETPPSCLETGKVNIFTEREDLEFRDLWTMTIALHRKEWDLVKSTTHFLSFLM